MCERPSNNESVMSATLTGSDRISIASTCRQAAEAALGQMNNSVNWSMTLSLAVAGFVAQLIFANSQGVTNVLLLALIIMMLVSTAVLVNFFDRTAKSYINVIRFALVERAALREAFSIDHGNKITLNTAVLEYQVNWKNPLKISTIVQKVLWQFGFIYWFLIQAVLTLYLVSQLTNTNHGWIFAAVVGAWLIIIVVEIMMYRTSPYTRTALVDHDAMKKA